jgi:lipoyl(octanoyl) transferase
MATDKKTGAAVWLLLQQGKGAADYNMALDDALLESAPLRGRPVLRFYGWSESAATFGYSQKYSEIEKLTALRPLVRRPTGGGLVPHDADWTYSLVFPAGHFWHRLRAADSYHRVHEWVRAAFSELSLTTTLCPESQKEIPGQCFVGAEKDDVLWHGRKIAGAAQRRTRHGLLVQGSVQPPVPGLSRAGWETAMCDAGREEFAIEWEPLKLAVDLQNRTEELRTAKYSQPIYTEKR